MPAILNALIKTPGATDVEFVELDGLTDTFTASQVNNESLLVRNPTASPITFTMIGDEAPATVHCDSVGVVNVVAESVTVAAGDSVSVYLSDLRTKLKGVTTITDGAGIEAALVTY